MWRQRSRSPAARRGGALATGQRAAPPELSSLNRALAQRRAGGSRETRLSDWVAQQQSGFAHAHAWTQRHGQGRGALQVDELHEIRDYLDGAAAREKSLRGADPTRTAIFIDRSTDLRTVEAVLNEFVRRVYRDTATAVLRTASISAKQRVHGYLFGQRFSLTGDSRSLATMVPDGGGVSVQFPFSGDGAFAQGINIDPRIPVSSAEWDAVLDVPSHQTSDNSKFTAAKQMVCDFRMRFAFTVDKYIGCICTQDYFVGLKAFSARHFQQFQRDSKAREEEMRNEKWSEPRWRAGDVTFPVPTIHQFFKWMLKKRTAKTNTLASLSGLLMLTRPDENLLDWGLPL